MTEYALSLGSRWAIQLLRRKEIVDFEFQIDVVPLKPKGPPTKLGYFNGESDVLFVTTDGGRYRIEIVKEDE